MAMKFESILMRLKGCLDCCSTGLSDVQNVNHATSLKMQVRCFHVRVNARANVLLGSKRDISLMPAGNNSAQIVYRHARLSWR
jgi:hypothetical protein